MRGKMMAESTNATFRMDASDLARLDALAAHYKTTRSEVIRRVLLSWIEFEEPSMQFRQEILADAAGIRSGEIERNLE